MKVLQLVDSLEVGGTERVAVNIANALSKKIDKSFLCATRKEGLLKESLNSKVEYLFLVKRRTLDLKAITTLRSFVGLHKVDIIHAHSSSFFLAVLLKIIYPKIKIVWHDHYGNSKFLDQRKSRVLVLTSKFFSHILSVNKVLKDWAEVNLKCKNIDFLPNFANPDKNKPKTKLKGKVGKRIIHLANLRPQKDHETLFKAFKGVIKHYPDWSLHCVGLDLKDEYSKKVRTIIDKLKLQNHVFFYGSRQDISNILGQADIAVLSSKSEGLPLALLEYGMAGLPSVVTNVGDCNQVISSKEEGLLVKSGNKKVLKDALISLIADSKLRQRIGTGLNKKVLNSFSEKAQINKLIEVYKFHIK